MVGDVKNYLLGQNELYFSEKNKICEFFNLKRKKKTNKKIKEHSM